MALNQRFSYLRPGSVMANLSPVMRQRVSAISTAEIQSTRINSDRQLNVPIHGPVGRLLLSSLRTLGHGLITLGRSADSAMGSDTVRDPQAQRGPDEGRSGRAIHRGSSRAYRISCSRTVSQEHSSRTLNEICFVMTSATRDCTR